MDMKSTIEQLYDHESSAEDYEARFKMLSISVPADEAAMLKAIAERFGQSLSSFAGEILSEAVREAFFHLTQADKDALAVKADADTEEYFKKKGFSFFEREDGSYSRWQSWAVACSEAAKNGGAE